MMKPLRRGTDGRGHTIVLALENPGQYGVWMKCENYAAHVPGGIAISWRYLLTKVTRVEAVALFERRVKVEELR